MFDICSCSCYGNEIARADCKYDLRIPLLEWDAFVYQKLRNGQLGRIDVKTTAARKRTAKRKEQEEKKQKLIKEPEQIEVAEHLCEGETLIIVKVCAVTINRRTQFWMEDLKTVMSMLT